MVFYVYVQHALIQMTLNISFFILAEQTNERQQKHNNCVSLWEHDCEVYIFVWSTGRSEWTGKKSRMNVEKNARKITDLGGGRTQKAPASIHISMPQISNEYTYIRD